MSSSSSAPASTGFDSHLAESLFPSLIQLARLAAASASTTAPDATSIAKDPSLSELDMGKEAAKIRTTLVTLRMQSSTLAGGDLSLDDQDWIVGQLENELAKKRAELAGLLTILPKPDDAEVRMEE